jgi:hypothetical protein
VSFCKKTHERSEIIMPVQLEVELRTGNYKLYATMTKVQENIKQLNISDVILSSLGNITTYSAKPVRQQVTLTPVQIELLKYAYRKANIERKKKIGKLVKRVSYCGTRTIRKDQKQIEAVEGEKGGIYYAGMQRCGLVWFCPDCMYKLMKARAEELYNQLQAFKKAGLFTFFVTFTIQHKMGDSLADLHKTLLDAFNFANTHRLWVKAKKNMPVEYLRALEVLFGVNGWHPHLHCVFVGDKGFLEALNIFITLYKQRLLERGLLVNEHTVVVKPWNGDLEEMTDYLFKDMLEQEITGGNVKKSGNGKTFFQLIDEDDIAVHEYINVMKGKHQYHHSRGFFKDVRVKTDEEIIKDDKVLKVLFTIPVKVYADMVLKGIALHLLNEYRHGGTDRAVKLLELYDCDTGFLSG